MFEYYRMKHLSFKERKLRRKTKKFLIKYLKKRYSNNAILFGTICPILCDADNRVFFTILGIKVNHNKLYILMEDWYDSNSYDIINYSDIIDLL